MKNVVILPMYNEEENAPRIVEHLHQVRKKFDLDLSVLAVNDGSRDSTASVVRDLQSKYDKLLVITYETNRGMGGALRAGIKKALEEKFDVLIFMDSDLTHDGNDIPKFLKKIDEGYDLVLGSRYISGGGMIGVPFLRVWISKLGNIAGRILLMLPIRDLTTGYRAAKREVFERIQLTETGFGIQLEETARAAAAGFRLAEVPMVLTTRKFGDSKMIYNGKLIYSYITLLLKCVRLRYTR